MRRSLIVALGAAAIVASAPAHAYVVQTATGSGEELHFTAMPQYFYLSEDGAIDISADGEFEALRRAFASWENVTESDAKFARLELTTKGVSDIYNDGGLPGRDRTNLVAWVETDWVEQPSQIAVTYTYYVDSSGKILEDDIVMNGVDYTWTVVDGAGVLTDVEAIAAHEIGHAFGLGHSLDADATMYATSGVGETIKRDLAPDDEDGIRHLYPPGCCKRSKAHDALAAIGCNMALAGRRAPAGAILLALGFLAVVVVRTRRTVRPGSLALAAFSMLALSPAAEASVAVELPLDRMSRDAAFVVRGHVVFTEAREGARGSIVTITQIEVAETLRGESPTVVTVVEPGGLPPGSDVGLKVSGAPDYRMGDEVVLFAAESRGAYATHFPDAVRTLGMAQGLFRVVREAGLPARVERDLSGVAVVTQDGAGAIRRAEDALSGLALDELRARVRE